MYVRTSLFALGVAAGSLSCGGGPDTAVVVHVETDIPWGPSRVMQSVRVRVYSGVGDGGQIRHEQTVVLGDATGSFPMPVRFGVRPFNNDASRTVTVAVQGCGDTTCLDPSQVLVSQHAIFSFIPGERSEYPMFLAMSCRGVATCAYPELTCQFGRCVSARVNPDQLIPSARGFYDASAPRDTAVSDRVVIDAVLAEATASDTPPAVDVVTDQPTADVRDASVADTVDAVATDAPPLDARADVSDVPAPDLFAVDARDVTGPDTFDAGVMDAHDATVDVSDASSADARDAVAVDLPDIPVDRGGLVCGATACRSNYNCCTTSNNCGCLVAVPPLTLCMAVVCP